MDKYKIPHKLKGSRGQGIVEVALALPILILVVFSIFEFGRYFFCIHNLKYAANEGGKVAVLRYSPSRITDKIKESAKAFDIKTEAVSVDYYFASSLSAITAEVDYTTINNSEVVFTNPDKETFCKISINYLFSPIAPYPLITNADGTIAINVSTYVKVQM